MPKMFKLTVKTPERRYGCHSGVFIVNFEHILHLLVFLLLTLGMTSENMKKSKGFLICLWDIERDIKWVKVVDFIGLYIRDFT